FRALTTAVIDDFVAPGDEDLLAVAKIIRHSRTLQERLTVGWESGAAAITAAVAETSGAADDDLVPAMVARTLWWTHRSIFLLALQGLLAGGHRGRGRPAARPRGERAPPPRAGRPAAASARRRRARPSRRGEATRAGGAR